MTEVVKKSRPKEYICKVCPVLDKFSTKGNLKMHDQRKHTNMNGHVEFDLLVNALEDKVQLLKVVD